MEARAHKQVNKSNFGADLGKMLLLGIGVALIVPVIETLMGRPTMAQKGNPHTKPPFPADDLAGGLDAKPGYD